MATLCGAESWFSKWRLMFSPAFTSTEPVWNFMSLATTVGPFWLTGPETEGAAAEELPQAVLRAAMTTRPRARMRRFLTGNSVMRRVVGGAGPDPSGRAPSGMRGGCFGQAPAWPVAGRRE